MNGLGDYSYGHGGLDGQGGGLYGGPGSMMGGDGANYNSMGGIGHYGGGGGGMGGMDHHHHQQQHQYMAQQQQSMHHHQQQQHTFNSTAVLPPSPATSSTSNLPEIDDSAIISEKMKQRGHVYEHKGQRLEIRDVWKDNLEEEMQTIRRVITKYNYCAIDTEFPGVVARPIGSFNTSVDFQYQTLRCNVDLLRLIQLGVAFADDEGNFAPDCPCWQFHFKFSLTEDMYAQDSIDLLVRSGIDFDLHEKMGIDVHDFGETLMSSGLVLMDDIKWISFHGGYDFGYLLKLLTFTPLPAEEDEFFKLLHTYFPCVYDVKHIMSKLEGATFKGGLSKLAEELNAERIGPMHQAGSDSLLTASVYFALRKRYFNDSIRDAGHLGVLHGLGEGDLNRF